MTNNNLALKLVEGTKADRDQYINRVEVLDKVKDIVSLPDGIHMTASQIAQYYEVEKINIDQLYLKYKEEFSFDGAKMLKGDELRTYKVTYLSQISELKKVGRLTIFPRQSVLRFGMLMKVSPIASKIRNYLVTVEKIANQDQKHNALKFTGEWNKVLDQFVFDEVKKGIMKGNTISNSISEIAQKIDAPKAKVHTRWYAGNKELRPLRDRLDKNIQEAIAKGNHLKLINNVSNIDNELLKNTHKSIEKHFINQNTLILDLMNEIKQLKSSNEHAQKSLSKLHNDMGTLWRGYKSMSESFESVTEDIQLIKKELNKYNNVIDEVYDEKINILKTRIKTQGSKIKKFKEELKNAKLVIGSYALKDNTFNYESNNQAFKMDRNGNLSRM